MIQSCRSHIVEHTDYRINHSCSICEDRVEKCIVNDYIEENVYECEICGKDVTGIIDLMLHEAVHGEQKPKTCLLCSAMFPDVKGLLRHLVATHDDTFIFGMCNRQYINALSLIQHMHSHISSFQLNCKLCKELKAVVQPKCHVHVTPYVPLYKCSCGMYASKQSDLGRHKILHYQANKYAAEIDHAYALHVPVEL